MTGRTYPDATAGSFPEPPVEFTDGEDRAIRIEESGVDDFDRLVAMYDAFDAADRAQGIPPVKEEAVREWLDTLLSEGSVNVVAVHEGSPVGHAILVPDREAAYELAVFVLHDYQSAGIGTELLEALLGSGRAAGVEKVWLTVERWNEPAIALYKKLGFETSNAESFELEMAIRLG
ncbi:GNAT family N-acetyltransferase [Halosimplex rubrum]|uniref:GNAT family N-acetyltransferase n=1 Tax=Halosimplex rubrum TaxID=869889 RepID=A0A7D5P1R3_9EURY|nr:GNAT family N-acetyltransferase [Halosimplex rubrum]QLH78517.1 GNAT family N-acetyltransferase [Halosimplex rubrum]